MSAAEPSSRHATPMAQVFGMLVRPGETLDALADQPFGAAELYRGYVVPLAAVGPVCGAAGLLVFGGGIARITLKMTLLPTLEHAVVSYGLSLVAVYVLALTIAVLAPAFGGVGARVQALKLVTFAGTALWLSGLFDLYPPLGFPLGLLGGLYSLYALHLGLAPMMRVSHDRALTYFACVLVAALLLGLLLRLAGGVVR
ncbi:Yip1 family protein [Phenylobacterium sp.]|uniref:Yip1 family protein n=1 Tax=Phenylobacterium sp. TaxID=1871053 RepID=UPI002DF374BA|nr:Yip1 family protein [Phenylobacterium sp.]